MQFDERFALWTGAAGTSALAVPVLRHVLPGDPPCRLGLLLRRPRARSSVHAAPASQVVVVWIELNGQRHADHDDLLLVTHQLRAAAAG